MRMKVRQYIFIKINCILSMVSCHLLNSCNMINYDKYIEKIKDNIRNKKFGTIYVILFLLYNLSIMEYGLHLVEPKADFWIEKAIESGI